VTELSLGDAYRLAGHAIACDFFTEDGKGGVDAFLGRRAPRGKPTVVRRRSGMRRVLAVGVAGAEPQALAPLPKQDVGARRCRLRGVNDQSRFRFAGRLWPWSVCAFEGVENEAR
jgi:hypothetical protein